MRVVVYDKSTKPQHFLTMDEKQSIRHQTKDMFNNLFKKHHSTIDSPVFEE